MAVSQSRFRRHADLRLISLEGEGVALQLREGRYFSLNPTGLVILQATQEPRTFPELVDAVVERFEVSRETAEQATRKFLEACLAAAVIVEEPG
ncbi:MAG: PqqD family protein [Gemmatimonadales bacterium]